MQIAAGEMKLRPFRTEDREALARLANSAAVAHYLANRFPHPYRLADADAWIGSLAEESPTYNFAVEWRGEFAGGAGLTPLTDIHSGTAEIGYWLGEPYWGRGLATQAAGMLTQYAFGELCFVRLQALVFRDNAASMRVLEKNGFAREGILRKHVRKFGILTDAVLYARLKIDLWNDGPLEMP